MFLTFFIHSKPNQSSREGERKFPFVILIHSFDGKRTVRFRFETNDISYNIRTTISEQYTLLSQREQYSFFLYSRTVFSLLRRVIYLRLNIKLLFHFGIYEQVELVKSRFSQLLVAVCYIKRGFKKMK